MEPISVAATAIELVVAVSKVGRLAGKIIADIKGCGPKGEGLVQLSDSLNNVSNACSRTRTILERCGPDSASETLTAIEAALMDLENLLESVDQEIRSTTQLSTVKRTVLVVQRKLSRKKLSELACHLDKRVTYLQQLITWDIWSLSYSRPTPRRVIEEEEKEKITPQEIVAAGPQAPLDHQLLAKSELTVTQRTLAFLPYLGQVQHAGTQRRPYYSGRDSEDGSETGVLEATRTVSLSMAFLSRSLAFQYRTSLYGPMSLSLRFHYNLDEESSSALAKRISRGTLKDLQGLLSRGEISLYTSSPFGSLFYMVSAAAGAIKLDICRFLLEQDTTGEIFAGCEAISVPLSNGTFVGQKSKEGFSELLDMILEKSRSQLCLRSYKLLTSLAGGPDEIYTCYARYLEFAPSSSRDLAHIALLKAVWVFVFHRRPVLEALPRPTIDKKWARLFGALIRPGSDPTTGSLEVMLRRSTCPFSAPAAIQDVLDIFESCGLDLHHYLLREVPQCWRSGLGGERVLVPYIYRGGLAGLSWEWSPPEAGSSAREVLIEFGNFNREEGTVYSGERYIFNPQAPGRGIRELWPFVFYPPSEPDLRMLSGDDLVKAQKYWRDREDRLARRCAKKSAKGSKQRVQSIPGAFPDD